MLLFEPPPSAADLHFRLFGFPVRVHPLFWLTTALFAIGAGREKTPPGVLLMWVAVVFGSILIHELGHALLQRHFGGRPRITLHGFGGLAACDDCDRSTRSQILISLAGPAAGFLFAIAVAGAVRLSGHMIGWGDPSAALEPVLSIPFVGRTLYWAPFARPMVNLLLLNILWVNVYWGLINLLPVYPLDGGRVARELLTLGNPRRGIVLSLRLSIVAAAAVALYAVIEGQRYFTAAMFGYLAYASFQTLQAYRASRW
ncbi:MAG: hypothetical protein IT424_04535 [Pirellulales bacterium]|nr:hypothetical protein [Pirellulales bacterium]